MPTPKTWRGLEKGHRCTHPEHGRGTVLDRPRSSFGWDVLVEFDSATCKRFTTFEAEDEGLAPIEEKVDFPS